MKEWVLGAISTVLIITVVSLILPEGKTAKFIKPFISMVLCLTVIAPIFNFNDFNSGNFTLDGAEISLNDDYLSFIVQSKIDFYTDYCIKIAEKNSINGAECKIEYITEDDYKITVKKVEINLQNAVITSDESHIVIVQRVKEQIREYLGLDDAGVVVYE